LLECNKLINCCVNIGMMIKSALENVCERKEHTRGRGQLDGVVSGFDGGWLESLPGGDGRGELVP